MQLFLHQTDNRNHDKLLSCSYPVSLHPGRFHPTHESTPFVQPKHTQLSHYISDKLHTS